MVAIDEYLTRPAVPRSKVNLDAADLAIQAVQEPDRQLEADAEVTTEFP